MDGTQALKPQVPHPTSCDGFPAAAALRRGEGSQEVAEGGPAGWLPGREVVFHSSFVGRWTGGQAAFPPCHAGWLTWLAGAPGAAVSLAGFEASPRASPGQLPGGRLPQLPGPASVSAPAGRLS